MLERESCEVVTMPEGASVQPVSADRVHRRHFFGSEEGVSQLVRFLDVAAFGMVAAVVYTVYIAGFWAAPWNYCAAVAAYVMLMVSFFHRFGLYDFETITGWPRNMLTLVALMAAVLVVLIGLAFALKVSEQFSRVWVFATAGGSAVLIVVLRGATLVLLRRWARDGGLRRNVALLGAGPQAERFIASLMNEQAPWQSIVGVFDDRRTRIAAGVGGHPVAGDFADLVTAVRGGIVDIVVVALPWSADARLIEVLRRVRELPVHVYLCPDLVSYQAPAHTREILAGVPVLKLASLPMSGWGGAVKWIEDKVLATMLLVGLAPLMAAIAVAIKMDSPGPVLFRQRRYGFNNEDIEVLKFRTMYHFRPPEVGFVQATRDDPRVTRLGALLRKSSLDELPQLFNVLGGSMSLIGPRPHAIAHNEQFVPLVASYDARHKVKPGITGWAQVNGFRGETDNIEKMRARVEHDIYYIENWSLWFDLKILILTALVVWTHPNAY